MSDFNGSQAESRAKFEVTRLSTHDAVLFSRNIYKERPLGPGPRGGVAHAIVIMWTKVLASVISIEPYVGVERVRLGRWRKVFLEGR